MHVLLLEPNTILAKMYSRALSDAGHSVAHATGAQAAIDAADKQQPDVVVLELQLPTHSGIEFLHEFRSYPEWQQVPVIVHTLIVPPKIAVVSELLARDLGVAITLYKPQTSLRELIRAVEQASSAL
ncbi:MAG TPA: response regulator [Candidatus Saccharimonadales bacterium]|nr:response regulator [Candidatus Saccharimonadales bacterium]